MNTAKRVASILLVVSLSIQIGCRLPGKPNEAFAALTAPISHPGPTGAEKRQSDGFVGKTTDAVKKTALFVGKGVLLAGGLVAWMWLDNDDETIIEQHNRERNERRWKNAWRDNPDVNPAMTAAFKDDHE